MINAIREDAQKNKFYFFYGRTNQGRVRHTTPPPLPLDPSGWYLSIFLGGGLSPPPLFGSKTKKKIVSFLRVVGPFFETTFCLPY